MEERTLDTKGLICPLPVLRARKALKEMAAGERITIEATDPAAPKDFVAFCEATGHRLVESREAEGVYLIRIEKA